MGLSVRASNRISVTGHVRGNDGYALVSVLFFIAVLSLLCAEILKVQAFQSRVVLGEFDNVKAAYAAGNGIEEALASISISGSMDTSFTQQFADGSSASIRVFQWGLYGAIVSHGLYRHCEKERSALVGSSLSSVDDPAFVLGDLQHGLVLAGKSQIVGDVTVGPGGVATGSLKDVSAPDDLPVKGRISKVASAIQMLDTSVVDREVLRLKSFLRILRRPGSNPDNPGGLALRGGILDLSNVTESFDTLMCFGDFTLMDTIMRRGPPLIIIVSGNLSFAPGACLIGPVIVCADDSISIPPHVNLYDTILASPAGITVQKHAAVTAQLFSPIIKCLQGSAANYPSVLFSVSLSDTQGVTQSIDLETGASVSGAVLMRTGSGISMKNTVIDLKPGSVVVGEIYTNGFLTLDGSVRGLVRAYDLYFYDSPTTYLGWMRSGIIDRTQMPTGFLRPLGTSGDFKGEILAWM